jgi:hypothetical protein
VTLPGGPTRPRAATTAPAAAPAPVPATGGPWPCYWLERTGVAAVALRRYEQLGDHTARSCADGWHQAFAWTGDRVDYPLDAEWTHPRAEDAYPPPPARSRRWPRECDGCGRRFSADARLQVWCEEVLDGPDEAEWSAHWEFVPPGCRKAGYGAMWDAPWTQRFRPNPAKPDDGLWLVVRCPFGLGNDWQVDNAASGGGFWTRTGDPRRPSTLSVSPSIAIGHPGDPAYYHGFLQSGHLTRSV